MSHSLRRAEHASQGYTPEIARVVHQSIVTDITVRNKANVKKENGEYVDRNSVVSFAGRSILSVGIDEMDEQTAHLTLGA